MTPEEELEAAKHLAKVATANSKHMAKFVLEHPQFFSEWAVEESKEMLKSIEKEEE